MHTILIVDDEPNYLIVLSELLADEGYETLTADNGQQGLEIAKNADIDLVITDMQMPGMDGLTLLNALKELNSALPVIMMTAFGEVDKAVKAMQAGAYNYLTKPFNNDELVANIKKSIDHYQLSKENLRLRHEMQERYSFDQIIGKNIAMQQIYALIEKVAPTPTTVLISGESGTGKELVARALHYNSLRRQAPFISVNCAALPDTLLESEFFGHEKGAFTGAVSLRKGKFEAADSGTIFLDEIGEMQLSLQAKMLRILQEKSFERVGGNKTLHADVRVIAATNKDLKEEVDHHRFREDLYYRLNVVHIHLPPLRDRIDDLPMLADHFVKKYAKQAGRPDLQLSSATIRFLSTLPWEGNIRELENVIERASILCNGKSIEPHDVHPEPDSVSSLAASPHGFDLEQLLPIDAKLPDVLNEIEGKMVKRALEQTNFIQTKAANLLGITKSLLQYKMKKFDIKKSDS
jgi:two-component system NtrC family response regulator